MWRKAAPETSSSRTAILAMITGGTGTSWRAFRRGYRWQAAAVCRESYKRNPARGRCGSALGGNHRHRDCRSVRRRETVAGGPEYPARKSAAVSEYLPAADCGSRPVYRARCPARSDWPSRTARPPAVRANGNRSDAAAPGDCPARSQPRRLRSSLKRTSASR